MEVFEYLPNLKSQFVTSRFPGRYDHCTVEKEKKSSSDTGDNAKIFSPEIPQA
jgi:hypothetical protein